MTSQRPCVKRSHPTEEAALAHQKQLVWKNQTTGNPERSVGLSTYRCPACQYWHVGHAVAPSAPPPVYHYTYGRKLHEILNTDALRVPRLKASRPADRRRKQREPHPVLWFSRNPVWERTAFKLSLEEHGLNAGDMVLNEVLGRGLYRFAVPASYAPLRFGDWMQRNPLAVARLADRELLQCYGNPAEWLATDTDVPLALCRSIEVYVGGWCDVTTISDADVMTYLRARSGVYLAALRSAREKEEAQPDPAALLPLLTEPERIIYEDGQAEQRIRLLVKCWRARGDVFPASASGTNRARLSSQ
jgi:hypothetical protein